LKDPNRRRSLPALAAVGALLLAGPALAANPALEGLRFELSSYGGPDGIPVYVSFDDAPAARGMFEIPKNPYRPGLSSVVLVATRDEGLLGLQAARMTAPGHRLVVVEIHARNDSRALHSFRLDDLVFEDAKGRRAVPVASAIGDSYPVAKNTPEAREKQAEAVVALGSQRETTVVLAFALPDDGFPLRCDFLADTAIAADGLPAWVARGGGDDDGFQARGTVQGDPVPLERRTGTLQTSEDVLFETAVELHDQPYAMEMSKSGRHIVERVTLTETLAGETTERSIPLLAGYGRVGLVAGRIRFDKPVTPRETRAPGSVDGVEVVLKSRFEARKGDVAVAMGRIDSLVFSIHSLE